MKAYFRIEDGGSICYYMVDDNRVVSITDRFGIKLVKSITLRSNSISVIDKDEFEGVYNKYLNLLKV